MALTAAGHCAVRADPPGPPPQLVALEADGGVRLVLDFTRGPAADPGSIQLNLDGRPLADGCSSRASRDIPPSRVEIDCPRLMLAPGEHVMELRLRLLEGGETTYRWPARRHGP